MREIGIEQKKDSLQKLVQLPLDVCSYFHSKSENGRMTEDQAKYEAKEVIRSLRYGNENMDYFWITDTEPVLVMHPYILDLEGSNVANYRDMDGVKLFMNMVDLVEEEGGGFVDYYWQMWDEVGEVERKQSYVLYYEPWDWIIGTGMYLKEVENEMTTISRSMMYVSVAVVVIVSLLFLFIIRRGIIGETERLKAGVELLQSENRYYQLVNLMGEGIVAVDMEGSFTFVSHQFCEMIGYNERELLGTPVVDYIAEENKQAFMSERSKRIMGQEETYKAEWKTRDGGDLITVVSPRILTHPNGEAMGSFAVVTDITDLNRAEEELRTLLQERTVLLKEIHHRVKNNLQLISSLLSLQYHNIEDDVSRNMLYDAQTRIQAMSRVHELFYQSGNFRYLKIKDFMEHLIFDIKSLYIEQEQKNFNFILRVDDLFLSVEQAVPCGLIMNELLSNSVKHAFPPEFNKNIEKNIEVFLRQNNEIIEFGVQDNGKGIPENMSRVQGQTLGFELITILVKQLKGTIEFSKGEKGEQTKIEIRFSL